MEHGVKKSFTNLREVTSTWKLALSFKLSIKGKGGLENHKPLKVQNELSAFLF